MSPLFSWVAKIGQSEVYLISPDTQKVAAVGKSFKMSFCSRGIRHAGHFGFIRRGSSGGSGGGSHFACHVCQCTSEALVDEVMVTLEQAVTVAVQQTSKALARLCEGRPLQSLHKLCERAEDAGCMR